MAKEKNFEDRRRERDREAIEEPSRPEKTYGQRPESAVIPGKIDELLARATPLIEQVNALYNQYIAGVESRPPLERRKHLDQVMQTLQSMAKPTATLQFRSSNLQSSYMTHKDRWDRMMKDLESGKLNRRLGGKAG